MTTLHDQLGDVVADVHADLAALTVGARRRGLAQRRRRRSLAAVGAAAAVAVVGGGAWALSPGGSTAPVATEAPSATASLSPSDPATGWVRVLVPLDARATAGMLAQLVAPYGVSATSSAGQSGYGESYARLDLAGGGRVEVNLQHAEAYDDPDGLHVRRGDDGKVGTDRWVATYVDHARGVRVSVAVVVPQGQTPPLAPAQLGAVASDPSWSFTTYPPVPPVPSPYTDLDGS